MSMWRVELLENKQGHYWWRLKSSGNGKILATSETYTTHRKAETIAIAVADKLAADYKDRT